MPALIACGTVADKTYLGGRLRVVLIRGAARRGDLAGGLKRLLDKAAAARRMRRTGSAVGSLADIPQLGMHGRMQPNDLKGLIGEIIAEDVLVGRGFGVQFYTKWKITGTSMSNGVDIILRKGDRLSANEAKHLHRLLRRRGASPAVSAALAAAFRQSGDKQTMKSLMWLTGNLERARQLRWATGAKPSETGELDGMIVVLKGALSAGKTAVNAVAIVDSGHPVDAALVGRRVTRGDLAGVSNQAAAVVVQIDGLREATGMLAGGLA